MGRAAVTLSHLFIYRDFDLCNPGRAVTSVQVLHDVHVPAGVLAELAHHFDPGYSSENLRAGLSLEVA